MIGFCGLREMREMGEGARRRGSVAWGRNALGMGGGEARRLPSGASGPQRERAWPRSGSVSGH